MFSSVLLICFGLQFTLMVEFKRPGRKQQPGNRLLQGCRQQEDLQQQQKGSHSNSRNFIYSRNVSRNNLVQRKYHKEQKRPLQNSNWDFPVTEGTPQAPAT
jgi:hypothetical protein